MSDQLRLEPVGVQGLFHFDTDVARPQPAVLDAPLSQPLVLDLDRTLIKTDLLFETFAAALHSNPLVIFLALWWLLQGKAVLKRRLAERAKLDLDVIPVNDAVDQLARAEALRGRTIVLATAADEILAHRIARRFPYISRVFATDGHRNLKGKVKATALAEAFPQGFIYAGDSPSDLAVWREASGIVLVHAPAAVAKVASDMGKPLVAIGGEAMTVKTVFRALRLKQWAKNVLIFVPVALAGKFGDGHSWLHAGGAFLGLGLVASSTYLINDIFDLSDDRRHWSKRNRPLAAGSMKLELGLALVPFMALAGLLIGALTGPLVLLVIVLYAIMSLLYSLKLKRVAIVDVVTLAGLFTLRLFLGVVAINALISAWLFIFSMALFLSLSIAKRHTEVVRMALNGKTKTAGRGYIARDEPLLLAMGVGAGLSAIVLFSLYLTAEAVRAAFYSAPQFLWIAPVVLFLWLGRVWLLSQRGELDDDPVAFALHDRTSLILGAVLGVGFVLAAIGGKLPWF